jgi:RNA polymerase sigma-70 factor (TIGR02943 family)
MNRTPMTTADAADPPMDPRAWVERHGDYLYRYALAKVRRADVAEELVQETLLGAWRGRAGFAGQASERSWLTAILKRKVIDWVRQRVRERSHVGPEGDAFDPFDGRGKWRKKPGNWGRGDPTADLTRDEFWATLHECLGKLPPRLHDVFILRYLDGATGPAVCQELGLTPTNLWVMLHRARLRVWECLSVNWFGVAAPGGGRSC